MLTTYSPPYKFSEFNNLNLSKELVDHYNNCYLKNIKRFNNELCKLDTKHREIYKEQDTSCIKFISNNNSKINRLCSKIITDQVCFSSIAPLGGRFEKNTMLNVLTKNFGSFKNFENELVEKAASSTTNEPVWLVYDKNIKKLILIVLGSELPSKFGYYPVLAFNSCTIHSKNTNKTDLRKKIKYLISIINWNFAEYRYTHKNKNSSLLV